MFANNSDNDTDSDREDGRGYEEGDGLTPKKRRKTRIPWDRNKLGDKNGLKNELLKTILSRRQFLNGKIEENFKLVADELSTPESPFANYGGILCGPAQKKYYEIMTQIVETLPVDDSTDLDSVDIGDEFITTALKILKQNRDKSTDPSAFRFETPSRKRNASAMSSTSKGEFLKNTKKIHKFDSIAVEINKAGINTIADLLDRIGASVDDKKAFQAHTGYNLEKSVSKVLGMFEEAMDSAHCYSSIAEAFALKPGQATELIEFLSPFYDIQAAAEEPAVKEEEVAPEPFKAPILMKLKDKKFSSQFSPMAKENEEETTI